MSDSIARALAISALGNISGVAGDLYVLTDDFTAEVARAKREENKRALITEAVNNVELLMDSEFKICAKLYDKNGLLIHTTNEIDLPMEAVVVHGEYDKVKKALILTLKSGEKIEIPVADLIDGLATEEYVDLHDSELKALITSEGLARVQGDSELKAIIEELDQALCDEIDNRIAGDSELKVLIDSEAVIRAEADQVLKQLINSEEIARMEADDEIKVLIDSETAARILGDSELEEKKQDKFTCEAPLKLEDNKLSAEVFKGVSQGITNELIECKVWSSKIALVVEGDIDQSATTIVKVYEIAFPSNFTGNEFTSKLQFDDTSTAKEFRFTDEQVAQVKGNTFDTLVFKIGPGRYDCTLELADEVEPEDGVKGIVPAPKIAEDGYFLCADGKWKAIEAPDLSVYRTSSEQDLIDSELLLKIDSETLNRIAADEELDRLIVAERVARNLEINQLDADIKAEKSARESADTALDTKIANEVSARTAADTALETKLDNKKQDKLTVNEPLTLENNVLSVNEFKGEAKWEDADYTCRFTTTTGTYAYVNVYGVTAEPKNGEIMELRNSPMTFPNPMGTSFRIYMSASDVWTGTIAMQVGSDEIAKLQGKSFDKVQIKFTSDTVGTTVTGTYITEPSGAEMKAGIVPAPGADDAGKFLRADGTWASAGSGDLSAYRTAAEQDIIDANFLTEHQDLSDYAKKDDVTAEATARDEKDAELEANLNNEIANRETVDNYLEGVVNGKQDKLTAGTNITLSGSTISATDTTYTGTSPVVISSGNAISVNTMTAATASAAGKVGLVPAPAAGGQYKYLRGDATWQTLSLPSSVSISYSITDSNCSVSGYKAIKLIDNVYLLQLRVDTKGTFSASETRIMQNFKIDGKTPSTPNGLAGSESTNTIPMSVYISTSGSLYVRAAATTGTGSTFAVSGIVCTA